MFWQRSVKFHGRREPEGLPLRTRICLVANRSITILESAKLRSRSAQKASKEVREFYHRNRKEVFMGTILLIILILLLIGALPTWPYISGWGYYPSGGLGLVLLVLIILLVMGRI